MRPYSAARRAAAESAFRDSLALINNQPAVILKLALVEIAQGKMNLADDYSVTFLDRFNNEIGKRGLLRDEVTDYDPRQRGFYQLAAKTRARTWTEPRGTDRRWAVPGHLIAHVEQMLQRRVVGMER